MAVRHLVTAEELERMGKPDPDFELVRGELVQSPDVRRGSWERIRELIYQGRGG